MEVIRGYRAISNPLERPVITIGNFDGVHLGHQKIIETAVMQAKKIQGNVVCYTFRPHPRVALKADANVQLLLTYEEKNEALAKTGIDVLIEEPFSREFSTTSAEEFFTKILIRNLNAQAIVVGYDFAFGKERQGHLDSLTQFCQNAGVELTVVPPHREANEVVSSSRIRKYLLSGEIESANRLLGRPFFYRGLVMKGEGRGRKIGFPTANLKLENKLALPNGVYATWAVLNGVRYESVTNVGVRPTFYAPENELPALIETYLLDQSMDLYGMTLEVQFKRKLRDEKRFSGIETLKAQIAQDCLASRAALNEE